jgi:hypothetical protein
MRLVRTLERVGICILLASLVDLLLLPILLWRGESATLPFTFITLACATIVGVLWGIARPPTRLATTSEADRQLDLHDLLSTALTLHAADDPWAQAVLASANATCATLSPSSVVSAHFGARAWGGIGLATALVLTLAMIPVETSATRAETEAPLPISGSVDRPHQSSKGNEAAVSTHSPTRARPAQSEAESEEWKSTVPEETGVSSGRASDNHRTNVAAAPNGAGNGIGETRTSRSPNTPLVPGDVSAKQSSGTEHSAAGGAGTESPGNSDRAAGLRSSSKGYDHPLPWSSDSWPADRAAAIKSIETGEIPPTYRDVVRDYFDQKD